MYICSCHAVTDGAMRALIRSGQVRTFAQMAKTTGVATQCGICGRQAKELFYKILNEEITAGNISATADDASNTSNVTSAEASGSAETESSSVARAPTARSRVPADSALVRARDWQRAMARDRGRAAKGTAEADGDIAPVPSESKDLPVEIDASCARVCAACACIGCPGKAATPASEGS